jgi:hypothetical protein
VRQWNYVLLTTLWAVELSFIVSSSPSLSTDTSFSHIIFDNPIAQSRSSFFALLWPKRVTYQHIQFLRSFALLLSSALHHVVPNIFPTDNQNVDEKTLVGYMLMLQNTTKAINQEGTCLFQLGPSQLLTFSLRDHCSPYHHPRRASLLPR